MRRARVLVVAGGIYPDLVGSLASSGCSLESLWHLGGGSDRMPSSWTALAAEALGFEAAS